MKYQSSDNGIIARLDFGDPVIDSLQKLAHAEGIDGAHVSGIGALKEFTLGYFQPEEQTYKKDTFTQAHELTNFTGYITRQDNQVHVHAHATLADSQHKTVGGHLHAGVIAAAGEFFITTTDSRINRHHHDEFGLDLMHFSED